MFVPFLLLIGLGLAVWAGTSSAAGTSTILTPTLMAALKANDGSLWPALDAIAVRTAESGITGNIPGPVPVGQTMLVAFGDLHRPMVFMKGTVLRRDDRNDGTGGFNYTVSFTDMLDGILPVGKTAADYPGFSLPQTVVIPYTAVLAGPE